LSYSTGDNVDWHWTCWLNIHGNISKQTLKTWNLLYSFQTRMGEWVQEGHLYSHYIAYV
jgi:hypothetical protein